MAFEQRDNSGSLFKNDKRTEEKHPNYKGTAMIDGVEYWMSAWVKDGKSGKFMSVAFETKKEQNAKASSSKRPSKQEGESEEDMPF